MTSSRWVQGVKEGEAWAAFKSEVPITKAELAYTLNDGRWQERNWESLPAKIDSKTSRVTAKIPAGTQVFYLNLFDERDCAVSTEHVETPKGKSAIHISVRLKLTACASRVFSMEQPGKRTGLKS